MATILFAEDNDILRRVVSRALEDAGYHVIEARSAKDALAVFRTGAAIHCVITDVSVLGRNDPVVNAVEQLTASLPLIYASGHAFAFAQRRYRLRSGAPYLEKPFDLDDLLATIRSLVPDPQGPSAA